MIDIYSDFYTKGVITSKVDVKLFRIPKDKYGRQRVRRRFRLVPV